MKHLIKAEESPGFINGRKAWDLVFYDEEEDKIIREVVYENE